MCFRQISEPERDNVQTQFHEQHLNVALRHVVGVLTQGGRAGALALTAASPQTTQTHAAWTEIRPAE
ncbi:hypothetical protein LDENG_00255030 [Lucifuga dentata]|nr:hypothetical protein LDENG_00255030 [Lucifuga dentata]